MYAIDAPVRLLFHDVHLVVAFLALLLLCWRLPPFLVQGLAYVGDRSLFVFLAHSFVFRAISLSGLLAQIDARLPYASMAVLMTFGLTLAVTLLLHRMLKAVPRLYPLVLPPSLADWRTALGAR